MKTKYFEIEYGKPFLADESVFFLPHSCDEWVIGNLESAKRFSKELTELIAQVESNNSTQIL
jgi:hypothetical protein